MPTEPKFATQYDAFGQLEKVDVSRYCFKIICKEPGCFQIRYVLGQDRSQSHYCKLHARMYRLKSRARRARDKRKNKNKSKSG
jgi:hypothetical protein